jgi:formylmethanofuran dehydrogenase subunit B
MSGAELEEAIGEAARILSAARQPVIAGLGTDIAGVVAAFRLAEKIEAAIDHDVAESALRQLSVLRDMGMMLVTPAEAPALADTLLLVGEGPFAASPELPDSLLEASERRTVLSIRSCDVPANLVDRAVKSLSAEPLTIPDLLAALRARINGRPVAVAVPIEEIDRFAEMLRTAKYGVAIFSPEELDVLAIGMLTGLVKDLNGTTRWSSLPIPESATAAGATMAAGWITGLPLRSAFIGGRWQHDPWRFDARRLLAAGEADAAIYICSYEEAAPDWLPDIPAVLLVNAPEISPRRNAIRIAIGQPARDHDGILYDRRTATLVHRAASAPSSTPSVAHVLNRIAARLALS